MEWQELTRLVDLLNPNVDALDDNRQHDTLDALTASSRNKANRNPSALQSTIEQKSAEDAAHRQENDLAVQTSISHAPPPAEPTTAGAAELEQEAEGEGAFNPVTGEINWDCPCLGGMAYGPCGPEFREAFSCFVYSKEEPKGMDCIDKFQNMQVCFREHPEHYKGEIEDDESLDAELAQEKEQLQKEIQERKSQVEAQQQGKDKPAPTSSEKQSTKEKVSKSSISQSTRDPQTEAKTTSHTPSEYSSQKESEYGAPSRTIRQPQPKETSSEAQPESESLVPKASHDATDSSATDTHSVAK